jgi:hypothetical protein
MKFYYSIIIFLLTTFIVFGVLLRFIPTPKILVTSELVEITENSREETIRLNQTIESLRLIKDKKVDQVVYFEPGLENKRGNAILLYGLISLAIFLIMVILFHYRSYVLFPMITSLLICFAALACLWLFTTVFGSAIYIDLQSLRESFLDLQTFAKYLGVFLLLEIIVVIFGFWYEFPE